MPWQKSPALVLFVFLAVAFHYGRQTRAKAFSEITDSSQPMGAAAVQDRAKLFLQPTNQVPHRTIAARSPGGHLTSPIAATTSNSETPTTHTTIQTLTTSSVTTNSTPSTSPIIYTLITTLATPNTSHTTTPVTEATVGSSAARSSPPPSITPPAHTTGTSPATVSHTTSNLTTLPPTLSTSPPNSTTNQTPTQPTHASGTTTVAHNATQTTSPATTTPGFTLAPQPSTAKTGIYQVLNGSRLCIKAEMGIELTVQDTESVFSPQRYFNIDPNTTQASGNCGSRESNLLLNFPGGFVNLTFTKAGSYLIKLHPSAEFLPLWKSSVPPDMGAGNECPGGAQRTNQGLPPSTSLQEGAVSHSQSSAPSAVIAALSLTNQMHLIPQHQFPKQLT